MPIYQRSASESFWCFVGPLSLVVMFRLRRGWWGRGSSSTAAWGHERLVDCWCRDVRGTCSFKPWHELPSPRNNAPIWCRPAAANGNGNGRGHCVASTATLLEYRAAINLDSFIARTSLATGKEESKLDAAAAVQAVRVLLRRVVPDVDDMDLVDRIAQAQVKAYILQQHFETFPVECARGRGKGGKKQKRGAAGAAARANKANSSHRSDPTTPRPAPNTRTRCMVDHLLDGGSAQGFNVQGIGQ